MKVEYKSPKEYVFGVPIFNKRGRITSRVRNGLENVLSAYSNISKMHARRTDNGRNNYRVKSVKIVGSGAKGVFTSDLDFLLLVPNLDVESARNISLILAMIYFTDRPKLEAIDTYVRREDIFPERSSVDISDQVKKLLKKYNKNLR